MHDKYFKLIGGLAFALLAGCPAAGAGDRCDAVNCPGAVTCAEENPVRAAQSSLERGDERLALGCLIAAVETLQQQLARTAAISPPGRGVLIPAYPGQPLPKNSAEPRP
jgi:hypothetical protein